MHKTLLGLAITSILMTASACTLKGTTKAITDPTTDILSSSFRTWSTEEGYVREEYKIIAFASLNFSNLKQDMARGRGEYLASLGALFGIAPQRQEDFAVLVQTHFGTLLPSAKTSPSDMVATLTKLLAAS